MANEQNLIKSEDLTPKQRRELTSKAGKASVIAKRRKKNLKEAFNIILSLDVKSEQNKKVLENLGIDDGYLTNEMLVAASMFQQAVKGNVKAAEFIHNAIGTMNDFESERIKLEKQRLKIEKQKLQSEEKKNAEIEDLTPLIDLLRNGEVKDEND